jgi:hypothetical protein
VVKSVKPEVTGYAVLVGCVLLVPEFKNGKLLCYWLRQFWATFLGKASPLCLNTLVEYVVYKCSLSSSFFIVLKLSRQQKCTMSTRSDSRIRWIIKSNVSETNFISFIRVMWNHLEFCCSQMRPLRCLTTAISHYSVRLTVAQIS